MTSERRPPVEHRAANLEHVDFKERTITVIAVPYEQPAPVLYRGQVWDEVFSRSAFDGIETAQRRIPVTAVLNSPSRTHDHSGGFLIGKVGEAFPEREDGLVLTTRISKTKHGDDTLELAADGALSPSIGYAARPSDQVLDKQTMTRRVNRAFLDHLAFVAQPAFEGAQVLSVRSGGTTEAQLPELITPHLDELVADPLLRWAAQRCNQETS